MKLTQKQKVILRFISEMCEEGLGNPTAYKLFKYLKRNGYKEKSIKGVTQVINALEKKDLILRDVFRRIYLVRKSQSEKEIANFLSIPVFGLASCGEALSFADENAEGYLKISESFLSVKKKSTLFAVKALGDSMDLVGINDGDYVIFEKMPEGYDFDGKIVVAIIGEMATVKQFRNLGNGVIGLFPRSSNNYHQPIYIHESDSFVIAGVFKKVMPVSYISI